MYDPFGRRIEKRVIAGGVAPSPLGAGLPLREAIATGSGGGEGVTRYFYDNEDILVEYDGAWNAGNRYTHGPGIDEPLALTNDKGNYFYHADGLGSIVAITDKDQTVVNDYQYGFYGDLRSQKNKIKQPYRYTGREWDVETGLYFYRARYYDATVGRFLTRDPIGFRGGMNLYAYVKANPVNYVDPWGLRKMTQNEKLLANPFFGAFLTDDDLSKVELLLTDITNSINYGINTTLDVPAGAEAAMHAVNQYLGDAYFNGSIYIIAYRHYNSSYDATDIALNGDMYGKGVLIHELTHVWQKRNNIEAKDVMKVGSLVENLHDREYWYIICETETRPPDVFEHYSTEQQAAIIEDYFRLKNNGKARHNYKHPLTGEVSVKWYERMLKNVKFLPLGTTQP